MVSLQESRAPADRPGLAGKRILIVEDSFLLALDLRRIMESAGCVVRGPCASVPEALACLRQHDVDGAVLDFDLQETSTTVAAELVEQGIPFIVVSGYEHDFLPDALRREDYVGKPISRSRLVEIANERFVHRDGPTTV